MARTIRLAHSVLTLVTLTVLPLQQLHAEEAFPYQATISNAQALIYSGPSEDYYPTARIAAGDTVEVYRHESDGWCAIRPLTTSFSWVAAQHLEITDNPKLARIINVPVKTRVGSTLSKDFDAEYISLRKGEVVELLGSEVRREAGSNAPSRWFKIAPPAGEFRFVHQRNLQTTKTKKAASPDKPAMEPMDIPTYSLDEPRSPALLPNAVTQAQPLASATSAANDTPAAIKPEDTGFSAPIQQVSYETETETETVAETESAVPRNEAAENKSLATQNQGDSQAGTDLMDSATTAPSMTHVNAVTWEAIGERTDLLTAPEPRSFVDRYNALNIMLSRAILADIETWKLDKLQVQTQRLLESADSVKHQELAQGLADKVVEFQNLQARAREVSTGEPAASAPEKMASKPDSEPLPLPELPVETKHANDGANADSGEIQQASAVEMPRRLNTTPLPKAQVADLKNEKSIDNSIFDASGQLVFVKSRRSDIPKYALANSQGEIVQFIATKNGVNLAHLVNRQVGVLGKRGFLRTLNKPFLVADRVLLLQR